MKEDYVGPPSPGWLGLLSAVEAKRDLALVQLSAAKKRIEALETRNKALTDATNARARRYSYILQQKEKIESLERRNDQLVALVMKLS